MFAQFLSSPHVSRIVVLADGAIAAQGTYEELLLAGALDWAKGLEAMESTKTELGKGSSSDQLTTSISDSSLEKTG